jgi:predicted Zn-dependent protease
MNEKNLTIWIRSAVIMLSVTVVLIVVLIVSASEGGASSGEEKEVEKRKPVRQPIEYSLDCLENENDIGTNPFIEFGRSLEDMTLETMDIPLTVAEEEQYGKELLKSQREEYEFIESDARLSRLNTMLTRLVNVIPKPKGFHYEVHLIESDQLNAYTAGAQIFVTTRMMDFVQSDDELACILGHEIYHNELGHIKKKLQKVKLLTGIGAYISELLTVPFGQHDEAMCDLKGIDLVFAAGWDGCATVELWQRFKEESQEGDFNPVENLLRSHPYSASRSECSGNHIVHNYGFSCSH